MRQIKVKDSIIMVGGKIEDFPHFLPENRKTIIITDENIYHYYREKFSEYPVIKIGTGESVKVLNTVQNIIGQLIQLEADRSSMILGIGGGIVCDITGFVASVFMRGVSFGFISTTLLSQVDASVGGKNGVNLEGYKNIIGVFNQPKFVICDPTLLLTLPKRELSCGFAEIIKHVLIADAKMLEFLEEKSTEALSLKPVVINQLIEHSVNIKAHIVNQDEKEKGERKKLNFGHTFGHAIEKIRKGNHGEAVAIGMVLAAKISKIEGLIDETDLQRITKIIQAYDLPVECPYEIETLFKILKKDKKRDGDSIHFILLNRIGEALIKTYTFDHLHQVCEKIDE